MYGVITAIVIQFAADDKIDTEVLKGYTEHLIASGVYCPLCGTTGEML